MGCRVYGGVFMVYGWLEEPGGGTTDDGSS
jgi:hypothetical protein